MEKVIVREAGQIWKNMSKDSALEDIKLELEISKTLLNFFQVGDYYYYIINLKESKFDHISEDITRVLGYSTEEVSVPFLLDCIHPEDQPWFLNFENKVGDFFSKLQPADIPNYKVRYDYRIRKRSGDYLRILQQVVTIQFNEDNSILRTFGVHTDISHIKQSGRPVLSFIGLNGAPSYLDVDVKRVFTPSGELLTKREKEILLLLIDGNDSKTISKQLFISKQTVDTHRKNLLRKTSSINTAALVCNAIKNGWL